MDDYQGKCHAAAQDFEAALLSGLVLSAAGSEKASRFDELLSSEQFARTGLHEVALSLNANFGRLQRQAVMPLDLFLFGREYQELFTKLCLDRGRSPLVLHHPKTLMTEWSVEDREFFHHVEARLAEWLAGQLPHTGQFGSTAFHTVAGIAAVHIDRMADPIREYIVSMLIQAWTVFEALSEDLWVASVNFHPTILGALKGTRVKQPGGEQAKKEESDTRVSFNDLQRYNFDVKSRLGTILNSRMNSNLSFRSLDGIRHAYGRAFSNGEAAVRDILDWDMLRYLAAVRNLFIHKRGIVDDECIKQLKGVSEAPLVEIGDAFPLSGQICQRLTGVAKQAGMSLVIAVHEWILAHSD
jgi:hypothetical protein